MVAKIYRGLIPSSVREFIYSAFLGSFLFFIRHSRIYIKGKLTFLFSWLLPKTEQNEALAFIGRHGISTYPYPYSLEYKDRKVDILLDKIKDLPYVVHNGKQLFFPKIMTFENISTLYLSLITEQDTRSAHRYVASYNELKGKILLDIGSAEGIFSLDTIELVEHVYLFEYENFWQDALNATFAPWTQKVTIVENYVGDKSEGAFVTIDDFMKDKPKNNLFLKMDIEGAEQAALKGATRTLRDGKNINIAVCTYHKPDDPKAISSFLDSLGYSYQFTSGMMYWGKRLNKVLIRGKKE